MPHDIHYPILKKLGLSEPEVHIYEILMENGRMFARELVDPSGLSRGNVYNVLNDLEDKGLVRTIKGKKTTYEAIDPSNLRSLLEKKEREIKNLKQQFENVLPELASDYNLSTGKPAIEFYEGIEGVKEAVKETIQDKTEILTYVDISALQGKIAEVEAEYIEERVKKEVPKRIITANTPEIHEEFKKGTLEYTKVAFIDDYPAETSTAIQIYNDTILYTTLGEHIISIVIRDKILYEMEVKRFDYLWSRASEILE
jgi:sugar-specific transcriptional regulator TrmB